VGRSDAERNCLSNVRPEGLPRPAARKLWWLAEAARTLQLTGVGLKDRSDERALPGAGEGSDWLSRTTGRSGLRRATSVKPASA
jgi:ethanolamine ammonia-lyase small subunit